ncbi:MAG: iron-sulfur cluster assembly accessory protein [Bryobacterales bacterium]|nr:iron-sulfur cluster assembly accessory protein [Bryobacterales bacterium]
MIDVTPAAVEKIRQMLVQNEVNGGLRLGVAGGGCSGLSYKFRFETKPRPNDNVFEVDGVTLMVDPKSYAFLDGLTLDFRNTLMEQAFVFHNPNATKSCGCGKSFMA